jgi:hypothetical protein
MIEGLAEFDRQVGVAEDESLTHVAIDRTLARALLDALKASQEPVETLVLGDYVEVVAEHTQTYGGSVLGRKGTLINIEPRADNYPYSVEFRLLAGLGSQIMYFSRTELKKVET